VHGRTAWLLVVLLSGEILVGCGDDDAMPSADAGVVADGAPDALTVTPPAEPAAPEPPAPPVLTPCSSGWREIVAAPGDPASCDPWPETGIAMCPDDAAHFPGEAGCARVGSACPVGEWPEGLPSGDTVFVRAGGAPGGDGTQAAPFGTIAEALAGAGSGRVIALGRGTFDEQVLLPGGVTLWGACTGATTLSSSVASSRAGTVTVSGASAAIRNLRLGGERPALWVAGAGSSVELDDVIIASARYIALAVLDGGRAVGRSVVVRATRAPATGSEIGRGADVRSGGALDLSRSVVEANRETGVFAHGAGTSVMLADVAVRDTLTASTGDFGRGIDVRAGASLTATRVALERNHEIALYVSEGGTVVVLEDAVVRGTLARDVDGRAGRALDAEFGGTVRARRVAIDANREIAVAAARGGNITLEDVVVRDTASQQSDGLKGYGLYAAVGDASLTATRTFVARNRDLGAIAESSGVLDLTDLVVRDTRGNEAELTRGGGVHLEDGGSVTLTRALIEANRDSGIRVAGESSALTLNDVVVRGTLAQESDRYWGLGLSASDGATVTASRIVLEGNRMNGAQAAASASIVLSDARIASTALEDATALFGQGLVVQEGASAALTRAVVEHSQTSGIIAGGPGSRVELTDVVVRDTTAPSAMTAFGYGVVLQDAATCDATRVSIESATNVGLFVSDLGTAVRASDVAVRDTASGANDGSSGRGISVQGGASLEIERAVLDRNREVGITAFSEGTLVRATGITVAGTAEASCAESTCPGFGLGCGAASYIGAQMELTSFVITHNALCGVQIASSGAMDLHDGEVSAQPIGANVQVDGYDAGRLSDRVRYVDNGTNLDTMSLPVPEPLSTL